MDQVIITLEDNIMAHTHKKDLEEYIFTRPEMAKLLGISTNALRMRMKKGRCDLEYMFNGQKFLFKRPRDITVHRPPQKSHEKTLRDYDRKVQERIFPKRYNRGSTHKEHGGEKPYKGKYDQQSFKHHNELKLLNSLNQKYKNDAQRMEFENMNEEALKEADKRAKEKVNKIHGTYHGRPKYGGMIYGASKWYLNPYDWDAPDLPDTSFNITGGRFNGYGNSEQMPEEKTPVSYYWNDPQPKDPGADYKPGQFKHLDEAIKNSKNGKG